MYVSDDRKSSLQTPFSKKEKTREYYMKKVLSAIILVASTIIALIGLFMIINGSLEMHPTVEQIEKVHITGWFIMLIGVFTDFLVSVCLVLSKQNKKYKQLGLTCVSK